MFSLSKLKIQHLRESGIPAALRVVRLLERPKQLLVTILIGNTLVNVAAATTAALLTADLSQKFNFSKDLALIFMMIIVTFLILMVGEITPKIIAVKNAVALAQRVGLILQFLNVLFFLFSWILVKFTEAISHLFGIKEVGVFFSQEELKTLIEVSEEKGTIEEDEREMIHSIFEFSHTSVREIMVPRIDMLCVESNTSLDELIEIIKENGYTRIPVYQGRVDNILGIIHAKDLLPYIKSEKDGVSNQVISLSKLARPVQFVPENKKIDDLLREFQREKAHLAIVVDEYGGTAGLITLEDILEEIVGEIQDEYDTERPLIRKIDDYAYLVDGKMNIYELQEIIQVTLPIREGYDTVAGLIFDQTGYVPKEQEVIHFDKIDFIIEKINRNRIVSVRLNIRGTHANDLTPRPTNFD
ncbi:hemolysin family protein [candidate division KSB1 bacterium]|nr:hemolysin family protein [candidate division KSB1 bacterium]